MILKQILIDDIKINFKKSNRAKNISIRIKSKDGVTVTIPRLSSIKIAEKFVHQKLNWIKKHYEKIQKSLASNTVFDTNTNYLTKFHLVKITLSSNMFSFNMTNEVVNINFPLKTKLHSEEIQNKIQTLIIDVYRHEANKYLPKQTQLLANRTNLKFQNISHEIFTDDIKKLVGAVKFTWKYSEFPSKLACSFSIFSMLINSNFFDA